MQIFRCDMHTVNLTFRCLKWSPPTFFQDDFEASKTTHSTRRSVKWTYWSLHLSDFFYLMMGHCSNRPTLPSSHNLCSKFVTVKINTVFHSFPPGETRYLAIFIDIVIWCRTFLLRSCEYWNTCHSFIYQCAVSTFKCESYYVCSLSQKSITCTARRVVYTHFITAKVIIIK